MNKIFCTVRATSCSFILDHHPLPLPSFRVTFFLCLSVCLSVCLSDYLSFSLSLSLSLALPSCTALSHSLSLSLSFAPYASIFVCILYFYSPFHFLPLSPCSFRLVEREPRMFFSHGKGTDEREASNDKVETLELGWVGLDE